MFSRAIVMVVLVCGLLFGFSDMAPAVCAVDDSDIMKRLGDLAKEGEQLRAEKSALKSKSQDLQMEEVRLKSTNDLIREAEARVRRDVEAFIPVARANEAAIISHNSPANKPDPSNAGAVQRYNEEAQRLNAALERLKSERSLLLDRTKATEEARRNLREGMVQFAAKQRTIQAKNVVLAKRENEWHRKLRQLKLDSGILKDALLRKQLNQASKFEGNLDKAHQILQSAWDGARR